MAMFTLRLLSSAIWFDWELDLLCNTKDQWGLDRFHLVLVNSDCNRPLNGFDGNHERTVSIACDQEACRYSPRPAPHPSCRHLRLGTAESARLRSRVWKQSHVR
jgi:hypothetical protein